MIPFKPAVLLCCVLMAGCSWLSSDKEQKAEAAAKPAVAAVQHTSPAWLDSAEKQLREAVSGSILRIERREDTIAVIMPIEGSFNPDRPAMLLPVMLKPLTRLSKLAASDAGTAVLVLGYADLPAVNDATGKLGQERASSIASLFRLSGMGDERLRSKAATYAQPQAAQLDSKGRVKERRVEVLVMPRERLAGQLIASSKIQ